MEGGESPTGLRGAFALPRLDRHEKASLLLPAVIIIIAELLFFDASADRSAIGFEHVVMVHVVNIAICLVYPLIFKVKPFIFQAFMLTSLLRILNIGMPSFGSSPFDWMPLIYIPIIAVGAFSLLDERFDFSMEPGEFPYKEVLSHYWQGLQAGLRNWGLVPIALAIGLFMSLTEFLVLRNQPMVPDLGLASLFSLFIVMYLCVGLGEELLFRTIMQERLQEKIGILPAMIATSLLFAMMHSGYAYPGYMAYVFMVSMVFGYLYHRTGSLLMVTVVHGTINFFLFSVLPHYML